MGGGAIEGTGGVQPMSIAGRVSLNERERTIGMTPEERAWRKKWLSDQHITPQEPRFKLGDKKEMLNPLRRLYRAPLDFIFEKGVAKIVGKEPAITLRFYTGRILLGFYGILAGTYYFKYNTNDWQSKSRWRVIKQKTAVYPGEPGYPVVSPDRQPHEYYDRGFSETSFAQKHKQYQK